MNTKYKLIGFLNMFNIVPDFVLPVFEFNGNLFFQEGENDRIKEFSLAKETIRSKIIPLDSSNIKSNVVLNSLEISSHPIYAFQTENNIVCGDSSYLRCFFEKYFPDNDVLSSVIQDFLDSIPQHKKEIIVYSNPLYQPKYTTYYGTGRRKTSVARVYICRGTGNIMINDRDIDNYFGLQNLKFIACQPLSMTDNLKAFDVKCTVSGGGVNGQAGAISMGIARALLSYDNELRTALKSAGLLTRDPRMKERKKYGLKAARKAPQFSKR